MSLNRQKLDTQLILEEGLRLKAYKDQFGNLTVGVGRNLDANPLTQIEQKMVGSDARTLPISHDNAIYLLHNDEDKVVGGLRVRWPWWLNLDEIRSRVMVDLGFNLGVGKLAGFPHFLAHMQGGEFDTAADDLQDSAWYNQVGDRGPRLVGMVRTGEDYTA